MKPYVKPVLTSSTKPTPEIYSFTKLTEDEMTEFARTFLPLLNPKLIKMITDKTANYIASLCEMADLANDKNSRGRILPFGWAKFYGQ